MADRAEQKRVRERARRAKFTPEQKRAASEHNRLWQQHKRLTDTEYLARTRAYVKAQYAKHRTARVEGMRVKAWETRVRCLQAYSGDAPFCVCCGEQTLEFLTLDHIVDKRSDDGVRVGGNRMGQVLYSWLIRMGFPAGFRVLCYNCNCSRGARGYCPHELQLDAEVEQMGLV